MPNTTIAIVTTTRGNADERELEESERASAGTRRHLGHEEVHGCAGQGEERAGARGERERDEHVRRHDLGARGDHDDDGGMSAATEPLMLMNAASTAAMSMTMTVSRTRPVPAPPITFWPTQVVTPVASNASATTKRHAMRMTVGSLNPASFADLEHARRPQRERDAHRDDRERNLAGDERHDGRGEDDERRDGGLHRFTIGPTRAACRAHRRLDCSGTREW